jgi:signal transduction histidine kinase
MGVHESTRRQRRLPKGVDRSTQRLMRLIHDRYADMQSSRQIEMMDRIARDSMVHLQKVARMAAVSGIAANTSLESRNAFATYVRKILGHLDTGKTGEQGFRRPQGKAAESLCINVNQLIQDVVRTLRRMLRKEVKLRAVLAEGEVRIAADPKKMGQVFASIVAHGSRFVRKGGTITILAKSLPIENGLTLEGGAGCALLSVTSTDVALETSQSDVVDKGRVRQTVRAAFSSIRSTVEGHNGLVRIFKDKKRMEFNIYLPMLHRM